MEVNTGIYFEKMKSNVTEQRVAEGKTPMHAERTTLAAGQEITIDLSAVKIDITDGLATGFIRNLGPEAINFSPEFYSGSEVTDIIQIYDGEEFDLGQFHGLIKSLKIGNTSGANTTEFIMIGV